MMPKLGLTKGGGAFPGPGVVEGVGGWPDEAPLKADAPDSSLNLTKRKGKRILKRRRGHRELLDGRLCRPDSEQWP